MHRLILLPGLLVAVAALLLTGGVKGRDEPSGLEERRAQLRRMTPVEKERVLRRQKRFEELDYAEQERLRRLHAQLEAAPDGAELRRLLDRYHQWLTKLSPSQRAEILSLTGEERLAKIEELRAEELRREEYRLKEEDLVKIAAWLEEQMLARLRDAPPDPRLKQFLESGEARQPGALLWFAWNLRWQLKLFPELKAEEAAALVNEVWQLSDDAKSKLQKRESPEEQQKLLHAWVFQATRESNSRYLGKRLDEIDISPQELFGFFQALPSERRAALLELPQDERQQALRLEYLRQERPDLLPPFARSFDPWSGRRSRGGRDGWPRSSLGPPEFHGRLPDRR